MTDSKSVPPAARKSSLEYRSPEQAKPTPVVAPPRLLKPRRALFVAMLFVWAGWIGVLLWMYFRDVKPSPLQPHPTTLRAVAQR